MPELGIKRKIGVIKKNSKYIIYRGMQQPNWSKKAGLQLMRTSEK